MLTPLRNLIVLLSLLEICLSQCFSKAVSRVVPSSSGSCPSDSVVNDEFNLLQKEVNDIIDREFPILQDLGYVSGCPGYNWHKVAEIIANESASCPDGTGFESRSNVQYCRLHDGIGCQLLTFPTPSFSHICGKISGYQIGETAGFRDDSTLTIEENYLDGISITHGRPRTHIWSYTIGSSRSPCPCNDSTEQPSKQDPVREPVGLNYTCDSSSGSRDALQNELFTERIWSNTGCLDDGCCRSSPYFYRSLNETTCDDLEVRLCQEEMFATIVSFGLYSLELYVR